MAVDLNRPLIKHGDYMWRSAAHQNLEIVNNKVPKAWIALFRLLEYVLQFTWCVFIIICEMKIEWRLLHFLFQRKDYFI